MCAQKIVKKPIGRDHYLKNSPREKETIMQKTVRYLKGIFVIQNLSHLSQIGLLVLGVFGYFYTVVPVFQNQQLQEQTSKLELEKSALEREKHLSEKKLALLKIQQNEIKQNIQTLQEKWKSEKNRNFILMNEISKTKIREIEARMSAITAKEGFQKEQEKLISLQWEYVMTDLIVSYSRHALNKVFSYSFANNEYEHGGFILEKEKQWPKPYIELLEVIDIMKNNSQKRIPDSYYAYLTEMVESNKTVLQCEKPDFKKIQQEYVNEISRLEPIINVELKQELDKEERAYKAKKQLVMFTEEYKNSIRRQIRLKKIFEIVDKYTKPLKTEQDICQNKASKVIDLITSEIRIKHLTSEKNQQCAQTVSE